MISKRRLNIDSKLLSFTLYLGLLCFLLITQGWGPTLLLHTIVVGLYSIKKFGFEIIFIFLAPITPIIVYVTEFRINRLLKKFKKNEFTETVIILGHTDWTQIEGWVKPNHARSTVKLVTKLLTAEKKDFSFFPKATMGDVENIMKNPSVKEVFFMGHGSSHEFQLTNGVYIYYCDFNNEQYRKEYVHQIHCGTSDGKSLIDYTVPEKNKASCFLIRKSINGITIDKYLKKRLKEAKNKGI